MAEWQQILPGVKLDNVSYEELEAGVPTVTQTATRYIRAHRRSWQNPKHQRQWVSTAGREHHSTSLETDFYWLSLPLPRFTDSPWEWLLLPHRLVRRRGITPEGDR